MCRAQLSHAWATQSQEDRFWVVSPVSKILESGGLTMKIMWLNESLVLRGESNEEKRALNVLFQTIGNEGLVANDVSGIFESGDPVDVPKV